MQPNCNSIISTIIRCVKGFIAAVHELEGCSAWGETRVAALREVETAIELWIEAAKEIGRPLPIPHPPALSFS